MFTEVAVNGGGGDAAQVEEPVVKKKKKKKDAEKEEEAMDTSQLSFYFLITEQCFTQQGVFF